MDSDCEHPVCVLGLGDADGVVNGVVLVTDGSTESTAVGKHPRRGLVILVASWCDVIVKPDSAVSTRAISGARTPQR